MSGPVPDAPDAESFQAIIAERRRKLHAGLDATKAQLGAIRDARGDTPADDEHDPEGATLSTEWSRAEGQRGDAVRELAELDLALHRLREGSFGICVSCGGPIPVERLRLLPAATLCVPCASRPR